MSSTSAASRGVSGASTSRSRPGRISAWARRWPGSRPRSRCRRSRSGWGTRGLMRPGWYTNRISICAARRGWWSPSTRSAHSRPAAENDRCLSTIRRWRRLRLKRYRPLPYDVGIERYIAAARRCQMISIPAISEMRGFSSRRTRRRVVAAALTTLALAAAGCSSKAAPHSGASPKGHKGGIYTILAFSNFGTADPAQNYTLEEWQLLYDTHDGLVQFQRVGGAAGNKLVPDLATAVPAPTNGGKTYFFHIRRGIKFSNGQVMKPSDFVTTFERQFTVPGPTTFYNGIVGASACGNASKTFKCDLTKGVVADDKNYTLTIHLTAPDPEFIDKLALPFADVVPAGTTMKLTGNSVPPGTGPYMWKSYNPNTEAVLVRNPYFY